jgi:hypothetical protein
LPTVFRQKRGEASAFRIPQFEVESRHPASGICILEKPGLTKSRPAEARPVKAGPGQVPGWPPLFAWRAGGLSR